MPKKWKHPLSDLMVQAKDCYDPADYVLVHKDHLAKLEAAAAPLPASAALQALSCCPDCGGGWTFDFGQKRVYCRTCEERKPTV